MSSEKARSSANGESFDNDEDEDDAEAVDANANEGVDQEGEDEDDTKQPARKKAKKKVKESVIDHTYRDYSQVEAPEEEDGDKSDAGKGKTELSRGFQSFPAKLHAILSNPNYQHIIRWMPHGRCWTIVDKYLLTTLLLPRYFAHGKFESFNRSVNGWGFKRLLRDGPDKRGYYHECFLRGRPELTKLMTRLCNPGKRLPDKSGEPDFYEISRKYPLPELPSVGIHPQLNDVHTLHAMQSPSAAAAHPYSAQQILFASPPIHHSSAGANFNRDSQGAAIPQLPQPMYFPAGPMDHHPAFQQSPFGFYAQSPFMIAPPQSMPGGPPGYYVVYQPPPLFMQAPHAPATALPYAAASSGAQLPDMASLLAAAALTSAGMVRDKPAVQLAAEGAEELSDEARVKAKTASQDDAKPFGGVGNSIAEV